MNSCYYFWFTLTYISITLVTCTDATEKLVNECHGYTKGRVGSNHLIHSQLTMLPCQICRHNCSNRACSKSIRIRGGGERVYKICDQCHRLFGTSGIPTPSFLVNLVKARKRNTVIQIQRKYSSTLPNIIGNTASPYQIY